MPKAPGQLIEQSTRHAAHLERLKSGNVNEILALLDDVNDLLVDRVQRTRSKNFTRARLEALIESFSSLAKEKYAEDIFKKLDEQLIDLSDYEADFEVRNLSQGIKVDFNLPKSSQLITAINSTPLNLGGRFQGSLLGGLKDSFTDAQIRTMGNTIRASYAAGVTTPDTIRALQIEAFPIGKRDLEAVVRTSLQRAANQTRVETWRANDDIVKGIQIIATLDGRTTTECRARDGQVLPIDSSDLPPWHYGCRTTTAAALDRSFDFLNRGETRAARDPETGKIEKVPAKQTYYAWLKNQPKAFQESVLGPTRTKLLRDGGLSAQRFAELQLDKRFKPVTLKEMRELDPVAFEKAGL